MNILIFNWRDPKHPVAGGAEKATYEIAKRWIRWGHQVHLVCGKYPSGQRYDSINGMQITRLGGKYAIYPSVTMHYFRKLKGRYDIVIDEINTIPFFTPLYVRGPKVAFIHQLAADVLFEELPWVQAKFWNLMEPYVLHLYRNMPIITSQSTKEDLIKIGIPESNIYVIDYGVDHNLYRPSEYKSQYPHIFYIGRLKKFKGVHYLIKAMNQVVKEFPNAKLSIVGKGDANYENELKSLTTRLNLTKNVSFYEFGFEDSLMQKIKIAQEAWILAFPSVREGFGLTVVEANACGTPAIATDVQGLRDTVKNYKTGILVPPKDVEALSKAIIHILEDDELRKKLSKDALEWSRRFDWNRTADKILRVLKNTIDMYNAYPP